MNAVDEIQKRIILTKIRKMLDEKLKLEITEMTETKKIEQQINQAVTFFSEKYPQVEFKVQTDTVDGKLQYTIDIWLETETID